MTYNLTKGSVLKNLMFFSLPYLLSSFLQTFYGLADLFITGQYNGSASISAVSIGSQIMHMVTVIIVGLAMGTTVLISQAVGSDNKSGISRITGNTITLFMGMSVVFTLVLVALRNQIIDIMLVPSEAVSETRIYITICFLGIPFITAYNIISCIFRGMGDSKSPMIFIGVACVINIAIDYLMIGVLGMGAAGAAYGTVISQTVSVVVALISVLKKNMGIVLGRDDLVPDKKTIHKMLKIGVPVALQDGLIQVSFIVITIIANGRGLEVATSVGIVEKIIGFLFLIPSAMLSSVSAIAAQNVGAGETKRARKTLWYATGIAVTCGLIFAVVCQFLAPQIIQLFDDDSQVVKLGAQYLKTYVFDCSLAAVHFCFSGFFCAYGWSIISFIHNIASIAIVRIPGAYLASKLYPDTLYEMGAAAPLGSLLSAIICVSIYIVLRKKKKI